VNAGGEGQKANVIFVLGGPGAGKGTQCENIVNNYSYKHLSAGDLLRAERNNPESAHGKLISNYIKEGKIVPVEITCTLLDNAMQEEMKKADGRSNFLIDGFPRNQDNLDGWNKHMGERVNVKFVLYFECTKEVCVDRILERGKTSGRTDDNKEAIEKRFNTYYNETMSIINLFQGKDMVKTIDATQTVGDVFEAVKKII